MMNKPPDKKVDAKQAAKNPRPSAPRPGLDVPPSGEGDDKPPENSLAIRIVGLCMGVMSLCLGDYFVNTIPTMWAVHVFALLTGTYMSYINRETKTKWQSSVVIGGICLVAANCWFELNAGLQQGEASPFTPGVHFLVGTYAMQSFELRTRGDINTSMLLGLIILGLVAPIGKSIIFGAAIFIYVCLLVSLMYFDCVNRTREGWESEAVKEVLLTPTLEKSGIVFQGITPLCLALMPILSACLFLVLPRADAYVDRTYAYLSSVFGKKSTDLIMMPEALPEGARRWTKPEGEKRKNSDQALADGVAKKKNTFKTENEEDQLESASKNKGKEGKESDEDKGQPTDKSNKNSKNKIKNTKVTVERGKKQKAPPSNVKGSAVSTPNPVDALGYDDEMSISGNAPTSNALVLRVRSSRVCYSKLYDFDKYELNGKWTDSLTEVTELEKNPRGAVDLSQVKSLALPTNLASIQLPQDVVVECQMSRNIPAAWVPTKLDWKRTSINVDEMGALRLAGDAELKKGDKYTVTSTFPLYDLEKMKKEQPKDSSTETDYRFRLSRYLQLPEDLPEQLVDLADHVGSPGTNWFNKADLIAEYLRTNYKYSYTKNHGDSDDPLSEFLFDDPGKKGDCKDFATALIIMLRCEGIPARIVCGFSPGDLNQVSGFREIKLKNTHAWAEVYVPDHGWVPFDATPKGYMPDKAPEQAYDIDSLQKKSAPQDLEQLQAEPPKTESEKGPKLTWQAIAMIISGIGVVGFCLFLLARALLKYLKKVRENSTKHHPARKFLKQVEAAFKKWKLERNQHETGLEFSRKVRNAVRERQRQGDRVDRELGQTVETFMERYEEAYYGNKDTLHELEQLSKNIIQSLGKNPASGAGGSGSGAAGGGKAAAAAASSARRGVASASPAKPDDE
jgi:hypothetical protein